MEQGICLKRLLLCFDLVQKSITVIKFGLILLISTGSLYNTRISLHINHFDSYADRLNNNNILYLILFITKNQKKKKSRT